MDRRKFIQSSALSALAIQPSLKSLQNMTYQDSEVNILNPLDRVPVSMIIDDSTALVNLAYYGIPQFGEVFPKKYLQDWRKLPREIPDAFVMEFIEWCDAHGVKGKYSMVPYPACTGWLHRFIPGWSKQELKQSLDLVRNEVTRNWDIHPEMISHTRVIDIKTGLPFPQATPDYMENWEWSQNKSADELGEYLAYALNVLKEAGYTCEGVTTPGGFGSKNMSNLASANMEAVDEVYGSGVSHFFRNVIVDKEQSVAPEVMKYKNIQSDNPSCSVHIIGCTADWFGGWDGLTPGDTERFITKDLQSGRMIEVIDSGEPALMVCHWPGIYYNGDKLGFNIFKTVVDRLDQKYGNSIIWMKLSEIAQYWAAKEFVSFEQSERGLIINAPFGVNDFTFSLKKRFRHPVLLNGNNTTSLTELSSTENIKNNSFLRNKKQTTVCMDLPNGRSELVDNQ